MYQRLLIAFLCLHLSVQSQSRFANYPQHSLYTYYYKISNEDALRIYRSDGISIEDYLHEKVDSFLTLFPVQKKLPPGHYVELKSSGRRIVFHLMTVGNVECETISNRRDLVLFIHQKNGAVINNAQVFIGAREIQYDAETNSYRIKSRKRGGTVRVEYDNNTYYFPVNKLKENKSFYRYRSSVWRRMIAKVTGWFNRPYTFQNSTAYERKHRGYVVFNKPKFKPGDTVKVKAFITTKNGKPISQPLLVRLTDRNFEIDTVIARVKPYRAGGYELQFVLHDSLDLDLDKQYVVTFEAQSARKYKVKGYDGDRDEDERAAKRKVLIREKFIFEEYELQKLKFEARSSRKQHHRHEKISFFLKGTDENGLPVADARVGITVRSRHIDLFRDDQVFVPDTLWSHSQPLESFGETRVDLPDSILPNANLNYDVEFEFRTSDNESHKVELYQEVIASPYEIRSVLTGDSVFLQQFKGDSNIESRAKITALNRKGEPVSVADIQLPGTYVRTPAAHFFVVTTPEASHRFENKMPEVFIQTDRTRDSVFLSIRNPAKLKLWYTIFAGSKLVKSGYSDTLVYAEKSLTRRNYLLTLQCYFNDEIRSSSSVASFLNKELFVSWNAPDAVYPGQEATISIDVKNADGKPEPDVDITAYAFTSKFENPLVPGLPTFSKTYPYRFGANRSFRVKPFQLVDSSYLVWQRWSRELQIDSNQYYRLLYTNGIQTFSEPAPDSITQFAPFVTGGGFVEEIHLIYIDDVPVFFSKAQQVGRYSFRIKPGKHVIRIRTSDKMITLDTMDFKAGYKTYISINPSEKNSLVQIKKMPAQLTEYETVLLNRYLILVDKKNGEQLSYIRQNQDYFLINLPATERTYSLRSMIGPIKPVESEYAVKNEFEVPFEPEGGFLFQFSKGLIKQRQIPDTKMFFPKLHLSFSKFEFNDYVMTGDEIERLWTEYLDNRSATRDLFRRRGLSQFNNGKLKIEIDSINARETFIRNIIFFRESTPEYMQIYRGNERDFGYFEPGNYKVFLLLRNDEYVIVDNISIKSGGLNFYRIRHAKIKPKDSVSTEISKTINERRLFVNNDDEGDNSKIKQSFNNGYLSPSGFKNQIEGILTDSEDKPIAGATVLLKGTGFGVATNTVGEFQINVPDNAVLVFSMVGFETQERPARVEMGRIFVKLKMQSMNLNDVVVVGYGTTKRKSITGAVTTVTSELQGLVPGIQIRGSSTAGNSGKPLIMLNGVPFNGDISTLDTSMITISLLNSDKAVALYGSRAAGGVILITSKASMGERFELPASANSLRTNFRDDAFWQPKLRTDANGRATFTTVFPDDITSWNSYALAVSDKKQTGFSTFNIRSFKSQSANIALPQFALVGDSINMIGKVMNYQQDTVMVNRSFYLNDEILDQRTITLSASHLDTFAFKAGNRDSLKLKYTIEQGNLFDGEERRIPVFPVGSLETKGVFMMLEKDTSFSLKFDTSLGKVKIHAEASLLPVMLDEMDKIRNYKYFCNEQLASKLKSLLMEKKVFAFLKKDFTRDDEIRKNIQLLLKNKSAQLWGWWPGNEISIWISLHVTEALLLAEKDGFTVAINKKVVSDFLKINIEHYRGVEKLLCLSLLKKLNAELDFEQSITDSSLEAKAGGLYYQLRLVELKQELGFRVSIDSLVAKPNKTMFGNIYWGEQNFSLFNNSVQNTILMYRIIRNDGGFEELLKRIRYYFLEQRKDGSWRNTYESTLILETILPDLIKANEASTPPQLVITAKDKTETTTFPFSWEADGVNSVTINKKGNGTIYFTGFQQSWNKTPQQVSGEFVVRSSFEANRNTVSELTGGKEVNLETTVKVEADAEYVMIEIPIPAGCSYLRKEQSWQNNEVHREHEKDKVNIFCSKLKKGSYVFTVSLMPRFTGRYSLNPAKAEMMYFPVFFGREVLKSVVIK